jgi:hypothetical protein
MDIRFVELTAYWVLAVLVVIGLRQLFQVGDWLLMIWFLSVGIAGSLEVMRVRNKLYAHLKANQLENPLELRNTEWFFSRYYGRIEDFEETLRDVEDPEVIRLLSDYQAIKAFSFIIVLLSLGATPLITAF